MYQLVNPEVFMIGQTKPDTVGGMQAAVSSLNTEFKYTNDSSYVAEFAGRMCYRSFDTKTNPNVTKVRPSEDYWANILRSGHGSVLEHVTYTFFFHNVSRVFTHELVRHRVGTAISQESQRFMRFDGPVPFTWLPNWGTPTEAELATMNSTAKTYKEYCDKIPWDDMLFEDKKFWTSYVRRYLPQGMATQIVWTANVRTIRHVLRLRTSQTAEEEMRYVFGKLASLPCILQSPFFQDMKEHSNGSITFDYST